MKQLNLYYLGGGGPSPEIPDGKTVVPVGVVETWIACAGRSEAYTTLAEVIADATCLNALMASTNAVDYLVRSTSFITTLVDDEDAMTAMGLSNYCANTLLADSSWKSGIFRSAYIDKVLNDSTPYMTSDNTPSGQMLSSSVGNNNYAYYAADSNNSNAWRSSADAQYGRFNAGDYIGYEFNHPVNAYMIRLLIKPASNVRTMGIAIQCTNDATWTDLVTESGDSDKFDKYYEVTPGNLYTKFKMIVTVSSNFSNCDSGVGIFRVYGRKDI